MERFYVEARAAAQLQHPNIVPIIEIGQWEGQRYFSMAFVDGASLDSNLSTGPFAYREAARLLLTVAEAVEYAHRRGVIHRDLKPANILIDARGQPHITDFGLAMQASDRSRLTATGEVIGTPSFMPPEQAVGNASLIGKTSDVYALGAVLYMALVGRPPFLATSTLDTLKMVAEREPLSPRQLDPTLPRDLETIVLKCLEKNPARRYASAQELADELQRFLTGKPIRARPVGALERVERWCRRNPAVATLATVTTVLLVATAATSTVAALRIRALRDEAVDQRQQATSHLARADVERQRAEQNLHYAHQMIRQLAESYSLLGDRQERHSERLQWYEKAHELLTTLAREESPVFDAQAELAESFGRLGMVHARAGQDSHAMKAFDQAVETLRHLCQEHPEQLQFQSDLARACNYLGRQYLRDNNYDAALTRYEQAAAFQESMLTADPPGTSEARKDLALYYVDIAAAQFEVNHFVASRDSYQQALQLMEPLAAEYPLESDVQAALAILYCEIGARRKSAESLQWLGRARTILEEITRAHPQEPRYRNNLARVYRGFADHESLPERSVTWQRQAHGIMEQLARDFPLDPDIQRNAVWSLRDDARFLGLAGYHREAITVLQRALERIGVVAPDEAAEKYADFEVNVLSMLARHELRIGATKDFREYCQAILERCRARNCYAYDSLRVCVLMPDAVGDPGQLVEVTRDAVSRGSRTLRKKANLGATLYRAGRYQEALDVLTSVDKSNRLALFARAGTAEVVRADNARVAIFLAMSCARLEDFDKAHDWLRQARQWYDDEGRRLSTSPAVDEATAGPNSASASSAATKAADSATTEAADPRPSLEANEDRVQFDDIAFEVQLLLSEAIALVGATRQ